MLLVIGNGFDINLGLKTKFSDYFEHIPTNDSFKNTGLYKYLQNAIKRKDRWIDLENELKSYAISEMNQIISLAINKEFDSGNRRNFEKQFNDLYLRPEYQESFIEFSEKFRKDFEILKESLRNYLDYAIKEKVNPNCHAVKYINHLLENCYPDDKLEILTFNYTSERCLKHVINHMCLKKINSKNIIYHEVHGTLSDNNLILGIEGTFKLPKAFNFLKKGLQENYTKGINIEKLLKEYLNIHFYGFSLGETDSPYFRQFFGAYSSPENVFSKEAKSFDNKKLVFFYFGQLGYDQIIDRIDELTNNNVDRLRQYNEIDFINLKRYEEENLNETSLKYFFPHPRKKKVFELKTQ